jgi:V/A-type H+-transporting ATPase subunit E
MSIEKIIQKINAETAAEINKILTEARAIAADLKKKGDMETASQLEHVRDQGNKRLTIMRNIHLSEARRVTRRSILGAKEELIQESFKRAKEQLQSLTGEQYKNIMNQLIKDSMALVGDKGVATVTREEDKAIVSANPGITVKPELTTGIGGLMIASPDGKIVVDNTFDAILERKKEDIRTEVANILYPEEG